MYRPARLHKLAGRYNKPMSDSTTVYIHQTGTKNLPTGIKCSADLIPKLILLSARHDNAPYPRTTPPPRNIPSPLYLPPYFPQKPLMNTQPPPPEAADLFCRCVGGICHSLVHPYNYNSSFIIHHSSFIIHHSSFLIPHSSFLIPHSPFIIHHSSFIIHHSSFIIHHSSFIIHHSSFIIHHSSFIIHHSSFIIHHSSFIIHHSSFIIHHSSQTNHPFSIRLSSSSVFLIKISVTVRPY